MPALQVGRPLRRRLRDGLGDGLGADDAGAAGDGFGLTAIRALSAQLKQQRRRHREESQAVQTALAAAHGENLELRRRLARHDH